MLSRYVFVLALLFLIPVVFQVPFASAGTFSDSSPTILRTGSNNPTSGDCAARTENFNDALNLINYGISDYCTVPTYEFDISGIVDDVFAVSSATVTYEVDTTTVTGDCVLRALTNQPTASQTTYDESLGGTDIATANSDCQSAGSGKTFTLNAAGLADLKSKINTHNGWYAFSFFLDDVSSPDGTYVDFNSMQLDFQYSSGPPPEPVDDLAISDVLGSSLTLSWTTPDANGGTISGYQINDTTPYGDPSTILVSNTGSTATLYGVTGLTTNQQYSFRVAAISENGLNATGNIANATTSAFTSANFTVGTINVNATNPNTIDIFYERVDLNSTALRLNIIYPNTFDLECNVAYKYARTNNTYSNLTAAAYTTTQDLSSFTFTNVNNEIIKIYCQDTNTMIGAPYLITISNFPLLEQIQSFQNGDYGTEGDFGFLDLITLIVVILSMIGFNRQNPTVGGIIAIMILGATAYFDIITIPTIIFGILAVVIMLIITTTRKT